MKTSGRSADLLVIVLLAAVYVGVAKLGLKLASVHASATAVWPAAGIALAALLQLGNRMWPAVFLGAFLATITTAGTMATSLGIATGNTLEAVAGAYLVTRHTGGRHPFARAQDVFKFTVLAGMVSPTASAMFGVTSLALGGFANWSDFGSIWLTWWLGDAAGTLLVAPLVILWSVDSRVQWNAPKFLEAALLLLALTVVGQLVFGAILLTGERGYPIAFIAIAPLVWAALRIGQREAATAAFILSSMALWGTQHGLGPFVRDSPNESLLLLQTYMSFTVVPALACAALVAEGKRAEEALLREAQGARLVAETSEARASFLAEVSAILDSSLDYDATLARIAHLAVPMLGDLCAIDLLEGDGRLRRVAHAHIERDKERLVHDVGTGYGLDPDAAGGAAAVLRSRRSLLHPEVTEADLARAAQSADHLAMFRGRRLKSWMIVPLVARERPSGTITFAITESDRRYGRVDLSLAEALANRAAMAIDNGRLLRDAEAARSMAEAASEGAQRRRREAEIFGDLTASISASLDFDTILKRVLDGAKELCLAEIGRIALRDPESDRMLFQYSVGPTLTNHHPVHVNRGKGLGGHVWETGEPSRTEDHRRDPHAHADYLPPATEDGPVATLVVPIRLGDEVEGLIYLSERSARSFTEHDQHCVQRLADHDHP